MRMNENEYVDGDEDEDHEEGEDEIMRGMALMERLQLVVGRGSAFRGRHQRAVRRAGEVGAAPSSPPPSAVRTGI